MECSSQDSTLFIPKSVFQFEPFIQNSLKESPPSLSTYAFFANAFSQFCGLIDSLIMDWQNKKEEDL